MEIKQFEDKGLSHYSYALLSANEVALIDPGRDPVPYYEFAKQHNARITAVLETHSHADFVSSHLEIAGTTGATIYVSKEMGAAFPHHGIQDGDLISLGKVTLKALYTPGHSFDSLCFLLQDETGKEHALFSGDTLFIGDVGRPDLRESVQDNPAKREELARAMFHTIQDILRPLADQILLYPAHGAGTLCGKSLSDANSSTMGAEKMGNYAFRITDEEQFIDTLLDEQPFVPHYFSFNVSLNKKGAPPLSESLQKIPRRGTLPGPDEFPASGTLLIDARTRENYGARHLKGAFNIPDGLKFETWLGSILSPDEKFYLLAETTEHLETLLKKVAKIGYEGNILAAITGFEPDPDAEGATARFEHMAVGLPADFDANPDRYTILDARNKSEFAAGAYFDHALNIPLPELRERANEIPLDKPIVVHCAAGYRSGIASSILRTLVSQTVYDMGNAIERKKRR